MRKSENSEVNLNIPVIWDVYETMDNNEESIIKVVREEFNESERELELEPFDEAQGESESFFRRAARVLVAVLLVGGLLYISGIYQFLFYGRTPVGVEQKELASVVDAETLTTPLNVFIVSGEEFAGSERDIDDVLNMIENASRIWSQAGISVEAESVRELELSEEKINTFYREPGEFIYALPDIDPNLITVVLVRHLRGINGLAFGGTRSVAVADYTTSFDFRVLAHEIGHTLGLEHVRSKNRLMYSGSDGVLLSMEEVMNAREAAERYFKR